MSVFFSKGSEKKLKIDSDLTVYCKRMVGLSLESSSVIPLSDNRPEVTGCSTLSLKKKKKKKCEKDNSGIKNRTK